MTTENITFRGKIIGVRNGTKYTSWRNTTNHFYVKGRGYPITNTILKKLKEKGVETVFIVENLKNGDQKAHKFTLPQYLDAVLIQEPGFEQQRCVPLSQGLKEW